MSVAKLSEGILFCLLSSAAVTFGKSITRSINEVEVCPNRSDGGFDVKSSFAGFACEWDDVIPFFSHDGSLNVNVQNVFNSLNDAYISINGNSGMYVYLEGYPAPSNSERDTVVTPQELSLIDQLSQATGNKLVLGLPMYDPSDTSNAVSFLQEGILKSIDPSRIEALEYGNEPDHWVLEKKGLRDPASFSYEQYRSEFETYQADIANSYPSGISKIDIQGPAFAGCNTNSNKQYCWNEHYLDYAQNTDAKYISFHRYGQSGCSKHTTAESLLGNPDPETHDYDFENELARQLRSMGKELVWGEGNSLSCGGKRNPLTQYFATAVWLIDNLLENAVRGVSRAHMHADVVNTYSPFNIDDSGEIIARPTLYALRQFSEFIEEGQTAKVYRLNLCQGSDNLLKGYAAENGSFVKYLIVSKEWEQNSPVVVKFQAPAGAGATATVTKMTAPNYKSDVSEISVSGQQYNANGQLSGARQEETITQVGGYFQVEMDPVSSVVIAF